MTRPDPCARITIGVVVLDDPPGPSFRVAVPGWSIGAWLPRALAWPVGPEASDGTVPISITRGLATTRGLTVPDISQSSHGG